MDRLKLYIIIYILNILHWDFLYAKYIVVINVNIYFISLFKLECNYCNK